MAKKKETLTIEEKLQNALVPDWEQPYKLPENWCWTRLGALAKDMADGPFGSNLKKEHYTEEKQVRIIQLSNIGEEGWRDSNVKYTTFEHVKTISRSIVDKGDVVIAKMMPAGRAIIVPNIEDMYVLSSDAVKLKPSRLVDTSFLAKGINTTFFKNQVQENTQGITRARTSITKLKSYAFPLPPLAEQKRIVDKIESLFTKLDEAKELAKSALDSFENRKSAILHKAFTGELTKKWREENGVSVDSWIGKKLGDIIKVSSGKGLTAKNMIDGDIPVYGGNGINGYHNEANIFEDTLVIGRVGYYCGCIHYISTLAWVTDNALIVRFNDEFNDIKYLYYYLGYLDLRENDNSTAQPVISGSKIYNIQTTIPTLPEQQEIVRILDSIFEKEAEAKELVSVIDKIDLIKKSILSKAFRGELGTNDVNEESSVGLLREILEGK